ncbi:uncharacterized protein LOC127833234 [Dreissena polymorpha]|uniref:uncharacterized protein LOC127833234 n=1 Tax=Dreissena polymorpha TaxID=45954 RepID=UPI002264F10D|nr:uncharacterized protein LOC127833234 [Dreissena polymorpha]
MFGLVYFEKDNTLVSVRQNLSDLTFEVFKRKSKCSMKWGAEDYEERIIITRDGCKDYKGTTMVFCKIFMEYETSGRSLTGGLAKDGTRQPAIEDQKKISFLSHQAKMALHHEGRREVCSSRHAKAIQS